MIDLPKIALANIQGVETVVTPDDDGFRVIETPEWYTASQVEIINWLAIIDPEDEETRIRFWEATDHPEIHDLLREIADPTPPLPDEPPIRSFWKDRDEDEWVRRPDGTWACLTSDGRSKYATRIWGDLNEQYGPGEVIS